MKNLLRSIFRSRGEPFDDGIHLGVKQLVIRVARGSSGSSWPEYIKIEYDDGNGTSSWSKTHGCVLDSLPEDIIITIKLDYPYEYLTAVYGCVLNELPFSSKVSPVCSITFKSNKRIYGPFGDEIGEYFSSVTGNMIVGFYGVSDRNGLRELGAHTKPLHSTYMICPPKDLLPISNSYPIFPPKDLLPVGDSVPIKQKKDEDDNTDNYSSFVVANNQISGNEGDRNGSFVVGNRIKYVFYQYN